MQKTMNTKEDSRKKRQIKYRENREHQQNSNSKYAL